MAKSKTVEWPWVTRLQAAELAGLQGAQFDRAFRELLPDGAEQGRGSSLRFDAVAVVTARVERESRRSAPDPTDDPLLDGSDSPALERYRLARAKLAERDLSERDGETVKVSVLRPVIRPGLTALRSGGDALRRKFGNEAGDIFNEALDAFGKACEKALGSDDDET